MYYELTAPWQIFSFELSWTDVPNDLQVEIISSLAGRSNFDRGP